MVVYGGDVLLIIVNGVCWGDKIDIIMVNIVRKLVWMGYVFIVFNYCFGWNLLLIVQDEFLDGLVDVGFCIFLDFKVCVCFLWKDVVEDGNIYVINVDNIVLWGVVFIVGIYFLLVVYINEIEEM